MGKRWRENFGHGGVHPVVRQLRPLPIIVQFVYFRDLQLIETLFMAYQQFLRELEKLLEMESGSLKGDEKLSSIEAWDSLQILNFITLAHTKYGAEVERKVGQAERVADLAALVGLTADSAK